MKAGRWLVLVGVMTGCVEPMPQQASPRVEQGRASWACGFPEAAVTAGLERGIVVLRVRVEKNGAAAEVEILAATSPLFAAQARNCALGRVYEPARDAEGRRVAGWTAPFKVRFLPP